MSLISIKFQFIEQIMMIRASPKCGDARFTAEGARKDLIFHTVTR